MDFSKLSQNEKLMVYGAVAAVIGGIVGGISGIIWIPVLAAVAVVVVLLLPQFSPGTKLPGSRGSILVALGGVAAVFAALALLMVLVDIGFWFEIAALRTIFFLIGVAGALLVGWAAWQEFKAEGGKFNLGAATASGGTAASSTATEPPAPASTEPPPAPAEPMASDDTMRTSSTEGTLPADDEGSPRP